MLLNAVREFMQTNVGLASLSLACRFLQSTSWWIRRMPVIETGDFAVQTWATLVRALIENNRGVRNPVTKTAARLIMLARLLLLDIWTYPPLVVLEPCERKWKKVGARGTLCESLQFLHFAFKKIIPIGIIYWRYWDHLVVKLWYQVNKASLIGLLSIINNNYMGHTKS